MRRIRMTLAITITFIVVYFVGVFLCDLVGIGGYDGWVSEDAYRYFQFGEVEPWLFKLTESVAQGALAVGSIGVIASLSVLAGLLAKEVLRYVRNGL